MGDRDAYGDVSRNQWHNYLSTLQPIHGLPQEVLPVLLVRLRGLQHCDVHRPVALDRGLRLGLPLLRRLLLDPLCAAMHRLQAGRDWQGLRELHPRD